MSTGYVYVNGNAFAAAASPFGPGVGNVVAAIGDSHIAGVGGTYGKNDTTNPIGESPFAYALLAAAGRVRAGHNGGVTGETTTQVLARMDAELALGPDVMVICSGMPDAIAGTTLATTVANLKAMVAKCKAAGVTPVLCTLPPNENSGQKTLTAQINAFIRSWSARNKVPCVDFFEALSTASSSDFASSTYKASATDLASPGAKLAGDKLATVLLGVVAPRDGRGSTYSGDPANLVVNHMFTGGTTTPTSWSLIDNSSAETVNAIADDLAFSRGRVASLTVADTGDAQFSQTISTGFAVGDTLSFSCAQEMTGTPGELATFLVFNGASNATRYLSRLRANCSGWLSKDFVVPASTTSISVRLKLTGSGAGATARFAEPRLANLTALGAI